ncbi:MAG: FAD-dependent oxidoreductase [Aureliella sp.]
MKYRSILSVVLSLFAIGSSASSADLLVEAESFEQVGGWKLDTQFIESMGSPYLLAHGLGQPVAPASKKVQFPELGEYNVFVRTKDWVARWGAPGAPGKFKLSVDGAEFQTVFGSEGADWHWQNGGKIIITKKEATLELKDLTGFDGRCDAIYFTTGNAAPPNSSEVLGAWRKERLGLPAEPEVLDQYDLVVIGGGYSGMGSALSAARMGVKVALIQNRPVLGGNGSSEVRVWSMGLIRRGKYPRVGEIVTEFSDSATKSPGTYEEFEDSKKEEIIRAEPNIDLFLNHHAYKVDASEGSIDAVYAFDTRTGSQKKFMAKLYSDCTGHATIGYLAEADWEMTPKGRMGMSNMWAWDEGKESLDFPETPWALDLEMEDFPYPRDHHGQWFWESGFDKDAINDAEGIRDWNLRAVYGAFNAMKNRGGADQHKTAFLTWIAYIGGPRESRRLLGDIVLTQDDVVEKTDFPDGCVPSTWSIDLHYPKKQYSSKFPDNPFISVAVHDRRIDRSFGYPVPYRCFYSRNINNLFMAGRCISVTHEALGTTRVMKTCGMMGEVVGRAASICVANNCSPRDVYAKYWPEMDKLLKLPGKARRATVNDEIEIPADALPIAGPDGPATGRDLGKLAGTVVDDRKAKKQGNWTEGTGLKGYYGWGYQYAPADSNSVMRFTLKAKESGTYEIRIAHQPHQNRGAHVPVDIATDIENQRVEINMKKASGKDGFTSVAKVNLEKDERVVVSLSSNGAGGMVHADAVQLLPVK